MRFEWFQTVALGFAGVEKSAKLLLLRESSFRTNTFRDAPGALMCAARRGQVEAKRPATPLFAPVADKKRHIFTLSGSVNNGAGRFEIK